MGKRGPKRTKLSCEHESLLGHMTDTQLASISGVTATTIGKIRKERGIKRYSIVQGRPASERAVYYRRLLHKKYPGMFEMLGNKSDAFIGDKYGLSRERVRQYRVSFGVAKCSNKGLLACLTDDDVHYVLNNAGKMTDIELASAIGVSNSTIANVRKKFNIPNKRTQTIARNNAAIESIIHRLGVDSDNLLSRELGIPVNTIRAKRIKLGIQAIHTNRWSGVAGAERADAHTHERTRNRTRA